MSRADEIAQGLRDESGALTFSLVAEEYMQGLTDFLGGTPPPRFTTASYDLGRARAVRDAEEKQDFLDRMAAERRAHVERMIEILHGAGRPDLLAEFDAAMAKPRDRTS